MIDIKALQIYFPSVSTTIPAGRFYINTNLHRETSESFSINIKIRQQDTKEQRLIKFRIGLEQHTQQQQAVHDAEQPHFEIEYYTLDKRSFAATVYFQLYKATEKQLEEYAKGTVVIIARVLRNVFETHNIDMEQLPRIINEELILEELCESEVKLLNALHECFKEQVLIVRRKGEEPIVIRTRHSLEKYLDVKELAPLYIPLLKRIQG